MSEEEIAAAIDTAFAAYSRGDLDGFVAGMAEDMRYEDTSGAAPLAGREALKAYAAGWIEAASDGVITPVRKVVSGAEAAAELHMELTHDRGEMYGLAPTGRRIVFDFAIWTRFAAGKLVYLKAFYNPAAVMEQVGRIAPIPRTPR